jgi:hypothetical protein
MTATEGLARPRDVPAHSRIDEGMISIRLHEGAGRGHARSYRMQWRFVASFERKT